VANNKLIKETYDSLTESLEYEKEVVSRKKNTLDNSKTILAEAKLENSEIGIRLNKEQAKYMETAKRRLKLQKGLATILSLVQNNVQDRNIVEEAVVTALQAEAKGKSIMTALDVASGPDLTCSDVSETGSSDLSDYF
jgi:hypothetical protein